MEIHVDNQELREAVDQIMIDRGYLPMEDALGKRIGLDEFIKKYCPQHGKDWVKEKIIYKYHPDWCKNANPGEVGALKLMSIVLANGWKTIGMSCEIKLVGCS